MRHDERGNVFIIVLVLITILAVFGAAVLSEANTTHAAHAAFTSAGQSELDAEGAVQSVIQRLQNNVNIGEIGASGGCNQQGTPEVIGNYRGVTVQCTPDNKPSNPIPGDNPYVPSNTVLLLGGVHDAGNVVNSTGAQAQVPFCDDWYGASLTASQGGCENGLYIGPGVSSPDKQDTAITVVPNRTTPAGPIVATNGSILVRRDFAPNGVPKPPFRSLAVNGGDVSAWKDCVDNGFGSPPTVSGGALHCADNDGPGTWFIDPNFVHAVCAPGAASPSCPPPATVPAQCSHGFAALSPGWYSSRQALANLIGQNSCKGALIYFHPGVYYFDFTDTGVATSIPAPNPTTAGQLGQIIGGTAPANTWSECDATAWASPTGCDQHVVLQPRLNEAPLSDSDWNASAPTPDWLARKDGGEVAQTQPLLSGQPNVLKAQDWDTPIPTSGGRLKSIQSVALEIGWNVGPSGKLFTPPNDPGGGASTGAVLDVHVPNADCYIHLDGGDHSSSASDAAHNLRPVTSGVPNPSRSIDLTNGCIRPGMHLVLSGGTFPGSVAAWKANAALINSMQVTFTVQPKVLMPPPVPTLQVSFMQLAVEYHGQPAPQFPHGCDSNQPGVEWIFGGVSRLDFSDPSSTPDADVELCGATQRLLPAPNAPAVAANGSDAYKMAIYGLTDAGADAAQPLDAMSDSRFVMAAAPVGFPNDRSQLALVQKFDGIPGSMVADLGSKQQADVQLQLPSDIPIPDGSTITSVQLEARYWTGALGSGDTSGVGSITVSVQPGSTAIGSNGYASSPWSINDATTSPGGIPKCADLDPSTHLPKLCDWSFGIRHDDWEQSGSSPQQWSTQRTLTDALASPEGVRGATIEFNVAAIKNAPQTVRVYFDGIDLKVSFRPPSSLRPLRGCLTTRSRYDPGKGPSYTTGVTSGGGPYQGGLWEAGVDADWAPPNPSDASDDPYQGALPQSGGNDLKSDNADCALIDVGTGVRFHVQGVIYAPTAALDFSGNGVDTSWDTDGVVARQLSALRWKHDNGVPAFGGGSGGSPLRTRSVTLDAVVNGSVVLRAHVVLRDTGAPAIDTWIRKPV